MFGECHVFVMHYMCNTGVCEQTNCSGDKDVWDDKLSEHQKAFQGEDRSLG